MKKYRHLIFCLLIAFTLYLGISFNGALATIGDYTYLTNRLVSLFNFLVWAGCIFGWIWYAKKPKKTAVILTAVLVFILVFFFTPIPPSKAMMLKVMIYATFAGGTGIGEYAGLIATVWITYFMCRKKQSYNQSGEGEA